MQKEEQLKKNVLLMVPLLDQGGLERVCALTANLLKEKCKLVLVVFSAKNMLYDVSRVELIDLKLGSKPGLIRKIHTVFCRVAAVKRIKKERRIQVTYSFGPTANLVNVLSRVKDKIWVGIRGYGALGDKNSMKLFCRRSDKVICCAKVMADEVERDFHPKEVECLYNPCDVELIRRLGSEEVEEGHRAFFTGGAKVIASMGRADEVKGFWHLLKAFSILISEEPKARLMIIGDGDFSEYERLAEDLGIREYVLFTGVKQNPFAYLSKADLYVMTSISEGFPNALVEAMAVGLPVISTNCKTGPAEILMEDYTRASGQDAVIEGEYGLLVPVLNPVKNLEADVIEKEERILAQTAAELLRMPQKAELLAKKAAERSGCFSTERYVEQLLEGLQNVF